MNPVIQFEKSEESYEASELCNKHKKYSSSINRIYYSLLQYIKGVLLFAGKDLSSLAGQNSHDKIRTAGMGYVLEKNLLKNAYSFVCDFDSLRNLRVKADYECIHMDDTDYSFAQLTYEKMKGYFKYVP